MNDPTVCGEAAGVNLFHLSAPGSQSVSDGIALNPLPVQVDVPKVVEALAGPEMVIRRIADIRHHLEICSQALRELEDASEVALGGQPAPVGVSPITIRTLAACLSELLKLEWAQPHRRACHDLCKLLDCPQQPVLRQAIEDTVEVLQTTKCRFKSKELKRLRESLETLLGNSLDYSPSQNL